jgi:hypothetical protein
MLLENPGEIERVGLGGLLEYGEVGLEVAGEGAVDG